MNMYKKSQHLKIKITDLAEKNKCFGKLPDGISVFVEGVVAIGDRVEVEIIKIKKDYLLTRLVKILDYSTTRTEPKCKYFGVCGGCKWQHIQYKNQILLKQKKLEDALKFIGGLEKFTCEECIASCNKYNYRNKVDFSFTDLRYLLENEINDLSKKTTKPIDFALGFHPPGFFAKAIDIDQCYLATDKTNKILNIVRLFCLDNLKEMPIYSSHKNTGELRNLVIRHGEKTNDLMINLITTNHNNKLMKRLCNILNNKLGEQLTTFINSTTSVKNNSSFGEKEYVLKGNGFITDEILNYKFQISPNSFFQTNTSQAEVLYKLIIKISEFKKNDIIYDLFCGTGSISICISKYCKKILGIDIISSSISDAKKNAKINNIKKCKFIQLDIKNIKNITNKFLDFGKPNIIIVDPPRAGIHPNGLKILLNLNAEKIIYISCNPSSFARDTKIITEEKKYKLIKCIPVDLFPQTNHIESVSRFDLIE